MNSQVTMDMHIAKLSHHTLSVSCFYVYLCICPIYQVVLLSGHLDSWDVGQGAMDDGGGAMISWEALSLIRDLGIIETNIPYRLTDKQCTVLCRCTQPEKNIYILQKCKKKTKQTAVSLYKRISKQSQVNDLLFYLTLCNLSVLLRSTLEQCTKAKYSFYTDSSLYSNSHLVNTMKGEQSIQFQTQGQITKQFL